MHGWNNVELLKENETFNKNKFVATKGQGDQIILKENNSNPHSILEKRNIKNDGWIGNLSIDPTKGKLQNHTTTIKNKKMYQILNLTNPGKINKSMTEKYNYIT